MASVIDVARYLCFNYPRPDDVSKARLVKMMYLADWRSAIYRGHQITDIEWYFNHYGPYVEEPIEQIADHPEFEISESSTMYGNRKSIITYSGPDEWPSIDPDEVLVLDHVIETSSSKSWSEFLKLVYATYPVITRSRYSVLNLVALAAQYREVRQDLAWGVPSAPV
jgi:hypothetical protein